MRNENNKSGSAGSLFRVRSGFASKALDDVGQSGDVATAPPRDSASESQAKAATAPGGEKELGAKPRGRILSAQARNDSAEPDAPTASENDAHAADVSSPLNSTFQERPFAYVGAFLGMTLLCLIAVWQGNKAFAPEMYHTSGPIAFAKAFDKGQNFATFDLNINIREMRNEQIARFAKAPEVAVLGASHWQEAHVNLLPEMDFYNAHVHRDYYEDLPAVVEMFVRHDKLPRKMIIAIRDRLFTPVADRTDFLWLPGIPYYRAMAQRLGMEPHAYWETMPVQRWREQASIRMLYSNALRWYKAPVKPHATSKDRFETLDVLLPGGSIHWSGEHDRLFTPERSARLATEFANENFASPPKIDPKGIATLDRLLTYLKDKGVEVAFVHPPFNPIYYDRVKDGAYRAGLAKIEKITQDFGKKYGFKVFGSFNPADVGCTEDMYIDAEHSKPACLAKVFNQYRAIQAAKNKPAIEEKPVERRFPITSTIDFEHEIPVAFLSRPIEPRDDLTSDALAIFRRERAETPEVTKVALKPDTGAGAKTATLVPLPVQRPVIVPPLPSRNPIFGPVVNCVPYGPLRQHSQLFEPVRERQKLRLQLAGNADPKVERPQ